MTFERVAGIITCAAVIAAVAGGFAAIGPPQHTRLIALDHRRVSDLQQIERSVRYADARRRSETVTAPPRPRDDWPRDPETGQAYGYGRLSPTRYVVCATFALRSDAEGTSAGAGWRHGAGRTCYRLDAGSEDEHPEPI